MPLDTDIRSRLSSVRERIAQAARLAGRDPAAVRLVAVSKTVDIEHVRAAVAAGQRDFGENRVQEALQKIAAPTDEQITWHLVGHLQANKAKKAADAFHWIHSIDGADLLDRVDRSAAETGAAPRLLVQVDLAQEPTKHGAPLEDLPAIFARASECVAARVQGLMLLPPFTDDPESSRPYFRRLREVRDQLAASGVRASMLEQLSMGMSHDFEIAVQEGATIVRVGTAIFGGRHV